MEILSNEAVSEEVLDRLNELNRDKGSGSYCCTELYPNPKIQFLVQQSQGHKESNGHMDPVLSCVIYLPSHLLCKNLLHLCI